MWINLYTKGWTLHGMCALHNFAWYIPSKDLAIWVLILAVEKYHIHLLGTHPDQAHTHTSHPHALLAKTMYVSLFIPWNGAYNGGTWQLGLHLPHLTVGSQLLDQVRDWLRELSYIIPLILGHLYPEYQISQQRTSSQSTIQNTLFGKWTIFRQWQFPISIIINTWYQNLPNTTPDAANTRPS